MTKNEAIQILAVLKAAYPNSYKNLSMEEAQGVVTLWTAQFANVPGDIVLISVNKLIATKVFPPSIAEVKDKLKDMYCEAVGTLITADSLPKDKSIALKRIASVCNKIEQEPELQSFFIEDNNRITKGE